MQACILLCLLSVFPNNGLVIETGDVATAVQAQETGFLLLDVREAALYRAGHLPGAVNVPLKSLSEKRAGVPNLLKPVPALKRALLAAGVDPAKKIIIYGSGQDMDDMKAVGRVFWILEYLGYPEVAVMNGGLVKWIQEKQPVLPGEPEVNALEASAWTITPREDRLAHKAWVQAWLTRKNGVLVDSRSKDYYQGQTLKEGVVVKKGHIPGATSRPAGLGITTVVDAADKPAYMLFKAPPALRKVLGDLATSERIVTYCNGGNAASISYLLYRVVGVDNIAMYDGSLAEWSRDDALPVQLPKK